MAITVWSRVNVRMTFSCVIQPMVASADTDIQVCVKCDQQTDSTYEDSELFCKFLKHEG